MKNFYVNGRSGHYADSCYTDNDNNILFLSFCSYTSQVDIFFRAAKKELEIDLTPGYKKDKIASVDQNYEVKKFSNRALDIQHVMLIRKFIDNEDTNTRIDFVLSEGILDDTILFNKVNEYVETPLLPSWSSALSTFLKDNNYVRELPIRRFKTIPKNMHKKLWKITISQDAVEHFVKTNVELGRLEIIPGITTSKLEGDMSLNDYLPDTCETISKRIATSFKPKFVPGVDQYGEALSDFEDFAYNDGQGIIAFEAQKAVIQSMVKSFNKEHRGIIVGEMGCGKTVISNGVMYCHGRQLGYNAVVMAPNHLTEKWKREIENVTPNAKVYIVDCLAQIKALERDINNKNKTHNLFMVMSYESARSSYTQIPCPIFKRRFCVMDKESDVPRVLEVEHNVFTCPRCGQILKKTVTIDRKKEFVNMTYEDFLKDSKRINMYCENTVETFDAKLNKKVIRICGEPLWRPVAEDEEPTEWIKITGKDVKPSGWHNVSELPLIRDRLLQEHTEKQRTGAVVPRKERIYLATISKTIQELEQNTAKIRSSKKYPLCLYLKKRFKKKIDYAVFDEVHNLSAKDSWQGRAMTDLVQASRNSLCLTGTLINGKASSLYPILYRMFPNTLLKHRIAYEDNNKFSKKYGSSKKVTAEDEEGKKDVKNTEIAGVSPMLFTDFLLDVGAFIGLDDIADGLPGYQEIPVGVDLDPNVREVYDTITECFKENAGYRRPNASCTMDLMRLMSVYPDMPYNNPAVYNRKTEELVCLPEEIDASHFYDAKLEELRSIISRKVAAGEKVLVYYSFVNTSNVAQVIQETLEADGYRTKILKTNSTKTTREREAWINGLKEEAIDVLICNPKLVETGLDLFDYTTIVFYQMDYYIQTVRQASRRSYRLGQTKDIEVYFLYYKDTIQETTLHLMGSKMQASMTAEGKIPADGLCSMSDSDDLSTQVANTVIKNVQNKLDVSSFDRSKRVKNNVTFEERDIKKNRKTRAQLTYKKPYVSRWSKFKAAEPKKSVSKSTNAVINFINSDLSKWAL